mgnify:CR=1 FL=1
MIWQTEINAYKQYLQLERSLSKNSIFAYVNDVSQLADFVCKEQFIAPSQVQLQELQDYLSNLHDMGIAASTQARFISSIRSFYKFLLLEQMCTHNPTALLEMPKLQRKLPDVLTHDEIQDMISSVDVSQRSGHRNRAILSVLYGCGLRVSECCSLLYSNFHIAEEYVRITGKGSKQRLVPIHQTAIKEISLYEEQLRTHLNIAEKNADHIFLSVRARPISRIMVYHIVKQAAAAAGIEKNISPHTLRHSFATELVKNGANLRAVQDMLGHASITTTEIYTHLDQQHLRATIEKFHPLYQ